MIRTILRRVLLASWVIPFAWTVLWGIGYLMFGPDEATDTAKQLTHDVWFGCEW